MRMVWIVVALVLAASAFGCQAKEEPPAKSSENDSAAEAKEPKKSLGLKGKLTVRVLKVDRDELRENAVLKLELRRMVDVATRETEPIASKSIPVTELPVTVDLPYDVSKIEERDFYIVSGSILDGEKLLYGTDMEVGVLTYGRGEEPHIVLKHANIIRRRY